MLMNVGLTYFYANNFLTVDEEKYESQELYTEGMMNSFGAFVVDFIRLGKYLSYWNFSILVGLDTWTYIFPSLEIMRKIK